MPPISPQGSRGGLITAVVIFVIGFVTSTIFAIFYGVQNSKTEALLKQKTEQLAKTIRDTTSARITTIDQYEQQHSAGLIEQTRMGAVINIMDELSGSLIGKNNPAAATQPTAGVDLVSAAISDAAAKNGIDLPGNAADAIKALSERAASNDDKAKQSLTASNQVTGDTVEAMKKLNDSIKSLRQELDDANNKVLAAQADSQKNHENYVVKASADQQAMDAQRQQFNETINSYKQREADMTQNVTDMQKSRDQALLKLSSLHFHPEDIMVAQADGSIEDVASNDVVYINLGKGDHLVTGMTFEVYSQHDGIPKLGNGISLEDMPVGLGSIQVQLIESTVSQCKVIKLQPGKHINRGDLIANLVYDKNIPYNFYVFGKFDLQQAKHPTDADRDILQSLITRWGGKVQSEVNVDTDFVVMGMEPVIKEFSSDDLTDPVLAKQKSDQEAAVKDYEAVLSKARDLHIPILNQNRFLYYSGYYTSAQR